MLRWICIFVGIILSNVACSQVQDFVTWSGIEMDHQWKKDWSFSAEQQLRLRGNSTVFQSTFTDIGVKREFGKHLDVDGRYRFIIYHNTVAHRPYAEVGYTLEKKNWKVKPRIRYQWQKETSEFPENYLRPKLNVSYQWKKWEPFISSEFFYHLFYYRGDHWDEYRLSGGVTYDISKKQKLKCYYLYDREFNVNAPVYGHVAGIAYSFEI